MVILTPIALDLPNGQSLLCNCDDTCCTDVLGSHSRQEQLLSCDSTRRLWRSHMTAAQQQRQRHDTRVPVLQVGQYIVSKGGAVTAEQLAPYLDVQLDDLERVDGQVNESFVVGCPALVAAPFVVQSASLPDQLLEWGCLSCVY